MRVVFSYPCFENLGLEYLSACLLQAGFETKLVFDPQLFNDPFVTVGPLAKAFDVSAALPAQVLAQEPGLVAISVLAANYQWALDLAAGIRAASDVPIVFGGIHASAAPDAVMENPQVDYCIVGEGEQPLVQLATALRDGSSVAGIPNLYYRADGAVVSTALRTLQENLDSLPFPDKELFYREIPEWRSGYTLITRRGCVNRCSYCHNTQWNRDYPADAGRVRLRSVDNVMDELTQALDRYGYERVRINDDLFSYNHDWLREFCRRYKREIARPFMCFCSPRDLTDDVVSELKAAGCFQVCVGVQAVQESVRREIYCRYMSQDSVVEALAALRKHKLRATVDNILGYPGQTEEEILETAEFYLDNPVYGRFTVFWLIYFAGTEITEQALQRGELSAKDVAALERTPAAQANTLMGKRFSDPRYQRLHLMLVLMQMVPAPLARWLVKSGAFKRLPAVNPSLLEGLWTVFTKDRLDPIRRRYYSKYLRFGRQRLLGAAGSHGDER